MMYLINLPDTVMLTLCSTCSQDGKFSIWFVNYKNNDEYKKKLMAVNLISGWFQRWVRVLFPRLAIVCKINF
jgi:hypothetical protein